MSIINSMLRDLDARSSQGPGGGKFQQHVHAVPSQLPGWSGRWLIAGGVVALAIICTAGSIAWLRKAETRMAATIIPATAGSVPVKVAILAPRFTQASDSITPSISDTYAKAAPGQVATSGPNGVSDAAVAAAPAEITPASEQVRADRKTDKLQMTILPTDKVVATDRIATATAGASKLATKAASHAIKVQSTASVSETTSRLLPPASPVVASAPMQEKRVAQLTTQERAESEYAHAVELLHQGKPGAAVQGLEQAVRMSARHDAARQALVNTLIDMGRRDEAIAYAQNGLAENVAQPTLAMTLARLQHEKGELRPAIATLERTLPHAAARADYEALLAALLQKNEMHAQAAEHYLVALQKSPEAGVWWMGLGISYQAVQKTSSALEAFQRAQATRTLNPELSAFVETRVAQLQR